MISNNYNPSSSSLSILIEIQEYHLGSNWKSFCKISAWEILKIEVECKFCNLVLLTTKL